MIVPILYGLTNGGQRFVSAWQDHPDCPRNWPVVYVKFDDYTDVRVGAEGDSGFQTDEQMTNFVNDWRDALKAEGEGHEVIVGKRQTHEMLLPLKLRPF